MLGKLYFNEISIKVRAKRWSFEVCNSWENNGSLNFWTIVDYICTYVCMQLECPLHPQLTVLSPTLRILGAGLSLRMVCTPKVWYSVPGTPPTTDLMV